MFGPQSLLQPFWSWIAAVIIEWSFCMASVVFFHVEFRRIGSYEAIDTDCSR
jgi:hypothetical protein